jgi:hypothetical protein
MEFMRKSILFAILVFIASSFSSCRRQMYDPATRGRRASPPREVPEAKPQVPSSVPPPGINNSGGSQIADSEFENALQLLAVEIACLCKYNGAQTGDYTIEDPHDYYTPEMIREYLVKKSGGRTMTKTVYGVCFDYAQYCWEDVRDQKNYYSDLGVENYWIVTVGDDPNILTICDPTTDPLKATFVSNGVLLEEVRTERVRAHGDATMHAWIWIKRKTGAIYWLDPTWTDNTGSVVWGYVSSGKEIERPANKEYNAR